MHIRGNDGRAKRHGFHHHAGERFFVARADKKIARAEEVEDLIGFRHKSHIIQLESREVTLEQIKIDAFARADHEEAKFSGVVLLIEVSHGPQEGMLSLAFADRSNVRDHDLVFGNSMFLSEGIAILCRAHGLDIAESNPARHDAEIVVEIVILVIGASRLAEEERASC